jgi:hypothetical protein
VLAKALEAGFPHLLNASVCGDEKTFPPPPSENETAPPRVNDGQFGGSVGAHAAYEAACNWRALEISKYLMQLRQFQKALLQDNTDYVARWVPRSQATTGEDVIAAAAPALGVEPKALTIVQEFPVQRVVVFKHNPETAVKAREVPDRWRSLVSAPLGGLKELLDPTFPSELDFSKCMDESIFPHPGDGAEAPASRVDDNKFGGAGGAYLAYETICFWRRQQILHIHEAIANLNKGSDQGAEGDAKKVEELAK